MLYFTRLPFHFEIDKTKPVAFTGQELACTHNAASSVFGLLIVESKKICHWKAQA